MPVVTGLAVYVTVIGSVVLFTNVCAGIVPVPLVVTPEMPSGCTQSHGRLTPVVNDDKVTNVVVSPEHIVCGPGAKLTRGDGFTVTVTVKLFPLHPLGP